MHDVWLAAVDRLGRFRGESALRTWLGGFVVNTVRHGWRAELRSGEAGAPPAADDAALLATASRVDLDRAIAALPEGARAVLVLHDVEGYTHEEIGALLGIVPGTSKSQLARARRAVRDALSREKGVTDGT